MWCQSATEKIARDTQGIRKGYKTQRNMRVTYAQGQRNIRAACARWKKEQATGSERINELAS